MKITVTEFPFHFNNRSLLLICTRKNEIFLTFLFMLSTYKNCTVLNICLKKGRYKGAWKRSEGK